MKLITCFRGSIKHSRITSNTQDSFYGATTLSIMTLSIMTLSITTFSIMILSIMTFSIMTFSIMTLSKVTTALHHYAECRVWNIDVLNVIMLSAVMLSVVAPFLVPVWHIINTSLGCLWMQGIEYTHREPVAFTIKVLRLVRYAPNCGITYWRC